MWDKALLHCCWPQAPHPPLHPCHHLRGPEYPTLQTSVLPGLSDWAEILSNLKMWKIERAMGLKDDCRGWYTDVGFEEINSVWQTLWKCGWLSIFSMTASHHNLSPTASRKGGKTHQFPILVGCSIELYWSHGDGNYRTNWTNYTIIPKTVPSTLFEGAFNYCVAATTWQRTHHLCKCIQGYWPEDWDSHRL